MRNINNTLVHLGVRESHYCKSVCALKLAKLNLKHQTSLILNTNLLFLELRVKTSAVEKLYKSEKEVNDC